MSDLDPMDHFHADIIVCPYCGAEYEDCHELSADDGENECGDCGETYSYYRTMTVDYTTEKLEAKR